MPATYEPINTTTLTSAASSVTFSSIPQAYTDLVLVSNVNLSTVGATYANIQYQLNSDTGTNYSYTLVYGQGSSAVALRAANNASMWGSYISSRSGVFSTTITQFLNYSNSTTFKTIISRGNYGTRETATTDVVETSVSTWRNTSAITQILIYGPSSLSVGSTFTLYGIKAA